MTWERRGQLSLVSVLMLFSVVAFADGEDSYVLTIESVVEKAVATDTDIVDLHQSRDDLLYELGWGQYRDALSLRLSGSVGGDFVSAPSANGSSQLSAAVQVLPQLSLSGSLVARVQTASSGPGIQSPVSGSIGLTFRPLADASGDDRDELTLRNTEAEIIRETMRTSSQALSSLLAAVEAVDSHVLAGQELSVAEQRRASTEALYERERATDQQLDQAVSAVRTASQRLLRDEISAQRAFEDLSQLIGETVTVDNLPSWSALGLDDLVASAVTARSSLTPELLAEDDSDVEKARQNVEAAEISVAAARRFTPDLSVSASASLPDFSYQVSAEFSISPSDWSGDDVENAQTALDRANQRYDYALRSATLDTASALLELDIALSGVDVAREDLADADSALAEAQFRLSRGDVTQLAVQEAELAVANAQHSFYSALASALKRWATIEYQQF